VSHTSDILGKDVISSLPLCMVFSRRVTVSTESFTAAVIQGIGNILLSYR